MPLWCSGELTQWHTVMRGGRERAEQAKLFDPKVLRDFPGVTTKFADTNDVLERVQVSLGKPKSSAKIYGTTEQEFLYRMTYAPATLKKPLKPLFCNGQPVPPTPPPPPSRGSSASSRAGSAAWAEAEQRPSTQSSTRSQHERARAARQATPGAFASLATVAEYPGQHDPEYLAIDAPLKRSASQSTHAYAAPHPGARAPSADDGRPTTALSGVSGVSSLGRLQLSRDPDQRTAQLRERRDQLRQMEEETAVRLKEMETEMARFVRRADGGLLLQTRKPRAELRAELAMTMSTTAS